EARPHERAAARAPLRPDRVPQRGDLLRPADAGAIVPGLRRGARAGRHPAARQGRDAVRGGARAPRPRGAAGTHLSPAGMSPAPKLVGGASMFAQLMTPGSVQMGERNIVAARNALRAASIPLAREAVGGGAGRSVRFHVADGHVEIRTVGSDAVVI